MLFYSVFKRLIGKTGVCMHARALHADGHAWIHEPVCSPYAMLQTVIIELKNDLALRGTLHSVDQYLNFKITDVSVVDAERFPHMISVKSCFIRGSVVRYVQLPPGELDPDVLQDSTRTEVAKEQASK